MVCSVLHVLVSPHCAAFTTPGHATAWVWTGRKELDVDVPQRIINAPHRICDKAAHDSLSLRAPPLLSQPSYR
jgi:hypothetical protein